MYRGVLVCASTRDGRFFSILNFAHIELLKHLDVVLLLVIMCGDGFTSHLFREVWCAVSFFFIYTSKYSILVDLKCEQGVVIIVDTFAY